MFKIVFTPWGLFRAHHDKRAIYRFLQSAARISKKQFSDGVKNGPKTGVRYIRRKKVHQASRGERTEYPANDTGDLRRSISSRVTGMEMEVGSGMEYSKWLRGGTRRMTRRKMSDDALTESMPEIRRSLGKWVIWKR